MVGILYSLTSKRMLVGIFSILVIATITIMIMGCWSKTISLTGAQQTNIPIPSPAIQLVAKKTLLSFVTFRRCDVAAVFNNEQNKTDWRLIEQMGGAYRLESEQGTLTVVTRHWFSIFIRFDYYLDLRSTPNQQDTHHNKLWNIDK